MRSRQRQNPHERRTTQSGQAHSGPAAGPRRIRAASWTLVLLAAGPLVTGCQEDTRMDVYEYLRMQQDQPGVLGEEARATLAATQPAEPSPVQPDTLMKPWAQGPYRVGPDDVLTVNIAGMAAVGLPETYTVRISREGTIGLPSIDDAEVNGKTLDEIENLLEEKYQTTIRDPQVRVEVMQYHLMDVIVLGDVAQPTTVELRRDRMSVLHAMLAAGGPVEFAGRVTIIPADDPDAPVRLDLSHAPELARAAQAGILDEGDVMIVDRRPHSAVFVLGLVNVPGPVAMPRASSLSVLQALASAGGTRLEFNPEDATVLRRRPDGTVLRVKLNLHRTMNGEDPDIRLAAGDILLVPHNADTRIEEFIARNLRMGFGLETTFNPWTHYYFEKNFDQIDRVGGTNYFDAAFSELFFGSNILTPAPVPGTP